MRYGVTPVPIPNTTVKTISAEGTVLETIRENRWLPDPLRREKTFFETDKNPDCTLKTEY